MGERLQVLDAGNYFLKDGRRLKVFGRPTILLDGKGGLLPRKADPVYLEIGSEDLANGTARNSAGQLFDRYPAAEVDEPVIVEGERCE